MSERNDPSRVESAPVAITAAHSLAAAAVLESLGCHGSHGLETTQVEERRSRYGFNELAETPPIPLWRRFLSQFRELVIWILIVAATASALTGEWTDALAILAIVLLNALLGFFQEERAERALTALQKLSTPLARVVRDGVISQVPARELVPGDHLMLEAGDNIPADARLLQTYSFRVQESALTGESEPHEKDADRVLIPSTALGDRHNLVHLGTVAVAGKASAVVVATGMNTELGHIAGMLRRAERQTTPLQLRLAELGRILVVVCLVIAGIIFVVELVRGGRLLDVLLLAISLAVAAVPEGLPAVVTVALTLGLQRMVKRNALIRRLPSVETLGCVTVICSDKTGTLTRNEMTVRVVVAGGQHYDVTGAGYSPRGEFLLLRAGEANDREAGNLPCPAEPLGQPDLVIALTTAARCNNAQVIPSADGESWQVLGDPTEGALVVAARKAGIEANNPAYPVIFEIPFDSERKAMSVVLREPGGTAVMYSKGAPEVLLARCSTARVQGQVVPLTEERRREIMDTSAGLAARALRVLGLAYSEHPETEKAVYHETELTFVGLVGMMDPPREEVKEAVRRCHEAGIRPVMITGDHPATALAIAHELDIARNGAVAVTGTELDVLSAEELSARLEHIAVYARVAASHKLRIVQAWKGRGQVVAMTGDGVNDAPAIKAADIGIAMGLTGTDVTKEASDLVLTDDNFASIVNAVEEGRGIFANIQKFLHYLLAGNIGLVLFVLVAALAGWPFPLTATQILWINLVTNGLPALALGMERPERGLMRQPPRPPREPVITWRRGLLMFNHGLLLAGISATGFALVYQGDPANLAQARTVAFCLVSFAFILYSFSCRSQRYTMPELGLFSNPYLLGAIGVSGLLQLAVVMFPFTQAMFDTATRFGWEWGLIALLALVPVTVIESAKLVRAWCRSMLGRPKV